MNVVCETLTLSEYRLLNRKNLKFLVWIFDNLNGSVVAENKQINKMQCLQLRAHFGIFFRVICFQKELIVQLILVDRAL